MKISIVIPSYKRPDLLKKLLDSIEQQTCKEYEIIVVIDGQDKHQEYLELLKWAKEQFERVEFEFNEVNRGACYCRNVGIKKAKYDLIALVDDDDTWYSTKLEKQLNYFKENKEVGLVYTWTDIIGADGNKIGEYAKSFSGECFKDILNSCFIPSPSVMVRKEVFEVAGLFDETFPSCQDWEMWTRVLKYYKCGVVKSFETKYYKHAGDTIGKSPKAKSGFIKYYEKNIKFLLIHFKFRHLYRYFRWKIEDTLNL